MDKLCKVLIVDDEYIMRQGIKHLINWDKEGFLIIGEATNGEEALFMIENDKPHIVVMDVVMPIIDGVELTGILHDKYPEIQIVVLSGFDKFEYVKDTLVNGAIDYILKPTLTPDEFLCALKKAAMQIPEFNFIGEKSINLNHSMEWYISGYNTTFDEDNFPEFMEKDSFRILGLDINYVYRNDNEGIKKARALIRKRLVDAGIVFTRVMLDDKNLIYVINYAGTKEVGTMSLLTDIANQLKNDNRKSFVVVSKPFNDIQDVKDVYRKYIITNIEKGFYNEKSALLQIEESSNSIDSKRFDYNLFSDYLRNGEYQKAISIIKEYFIEAVESKMDYEKLKNQAKNLIFNIVVVFDEYDIDVDNLRKKYFKMIDDTIFASEFSEAIEHIADDIQEFVESNITGNDRVMNEITKYILEHYKENLDLDTLAKKFNYNYNYLSSYFNSKNKEGFSGFLNKIRIDKGCTLLKKNDISIADVSYEVGYSDHSYFCRVFKKVTGYTPSAYRRKFR